MQPSTEPEFLRNQDVGSLVIESEDSIRETLEFCNLHIPLSQADPLHLGECTSVLLELPFLLLT